MAAERLTPNGTFKGRPYECHASKVNLYSCEVKKPSGGRLATAETPGSRQGQGRFSIFCRCSRLTFIPMQSSPTRISWDQQNCRASHFRPQDRELPIPNTLPKRKEEGRVCGIYFFIICNSSFLSVTIVPVIVIRRGSGVCLAASYPLGSLFQHLKKSYIL